MSKTGRKPRCVVSRILESRKSGSVTTRLDYPGLNRKSLKTALRGLVANGLLICKRKGQLGNPRHIGNHPAVYQWV